MPKIIISADDYGYSPEWNRGIIELAKKGKLTSISVMIDRKFVKAAELAKLEKVSLGLHLELRSKTSQKEIELQVKKFKKKLGCLPAHLDGHQHCHLTPQNIDKVLPVRSKLTEDRKKIIKSGVKTPGDFIPWHPARKTKMFRKLAKAKGEIIELVCHPGYFDPRTKYPYNHERELQLRILKSQNLSEQQVNTD